MMSYLILVWKLVEYEYELVLRSYFVQTVGARFKLPRENLLSYRNLEGHGDKVYLLSYTLIIKP